MDYDVPKILGGVANGLDVPAYWESVEEWVLPGTGDKSVYEQRAFHHGVDRFLVWTDVTLSEAAFQHVMFWHRETHRGELLADQREMLRENVEAAKKYNEVITAVGFAGLFALWTQLKDSFSPAVSFWAILCIVIALACFVGLEVLGMIIRARTNLKLAQALTSGEGNATTLLNEHRKNMHSFIAKYRWVWGIGATLAIVAGVIAGVLMLSAIVHSAWLAV